MAVGDRMMQVPTANGLSRPDFLAMEGAGQNLMANSSCSGTADSSWIMQMLCLESLLMSLANVRSRSTRTCLVFIGGITHSHMQYVLPSASIA
jgi:hypothetical protein